MHGNLQKTCSAKEKYKKTPNTPSQKGFDEKKIKIAKENTDVIKSSNQKKCTKSDQRNLKQLKNFNTYKKKSKRNKSIVLSKITPNTTTNSKKKQRSKLELDLSRMKRGTWNQATRKMSELLNEQYNSVFITPDPTRLLSMQRTFLDTHREIHCQTLILQEKTS